MLTRWTTGLSLCLALVCGEQASADAQRLTSAGGLASLFKDVCVASFPDTSAMARQAQRRGLRQVSPTHWANADTSLNVVVFSPGTRVENPQILGNTFVQTGWGFITLGAAGAADLKRGEVSCGVLAYGPPGGGLDRVIAAATAGVGTPKLQSARGGAIVKGRGTQLGGVDVRYSASAMRIKPRSGPQVQMPFVAVTGRP